MRKADIISFIESWSPESVALDWDNAGLQVGNLDDAVTNILVALEVTERVIEEAIENQVNLILTHHPLIFEPLTSLDLQTLSGRQISTLIKHDISVYSAHTNLDAAPDGVSITLAKTLGVERPQFLIKPAKKFQKKISVFVPESSLDTVRQAMSDAGAGVIGEYSQCSYNTRGYGTFWGSELSNPILGQAGQLETVDEIKLEMVLPAWKQSDVVSAMKGSHPYDEVAYDVYPLDNQCSGFGFGAIGNFEDSVPLDDLFDRIRTKLGVKALSVMEGPAQDVSCLAVCSGSGGSLVEQAYQQGAQAFITGEMKYHTFLKYEGCLTIIVAGHYSTEHVIVSVWADKLRDQFSDQPFSVIETKLITNPVKHII